MSLVKEIPPLPHVPRGPLVWAYETIPLIRKLYAKYLEGNPTPRYLKWELEVQRILHASKVELSQPYKKNFLCCKMKEMT
ncbi:hypothetical protein PanWU01x14_334110 [Parasponia andersonii]|uniref:Uncharacterized protein n=1 Tax=Parasponia andersonii TaxID=3476 RepID=A0A2P5AGN3_PARAD|nr:hypothetical protein PanWU01x14_334110 [Parasponia andersonii]